MVSTKEEAREVIVAMLLISALISVIYFLLGRPDTDFVIVVCGIFIVGLVVFLVHILKK